MALNLRLILAALLIASPLALASMILHPPEEELVRRITISDPTPTFGPKFHLTRGAAITAYSSTENRHRGADMPTFVTLCFATGASFMALIPFCQRLLARLKLLD